MEPFHGIDKEDCEEITVNNAYALHNCLRSVRERVVIIHLTEDVKTCLYLDKSLGCPLSELWICGFPDAMGLQLCGDLCKDLCSPVGGAYEHNDTVIRRLFPRFDDDASGNNHLFPTRPLLVVSQMNSLRSLFVDDVDYHMLYHLSSLLVCSW